jgi:ABC-2 type transport system ATP-binding protein
VTVAETALGAARLHEVPAPDAVEAATAIRTEDLTKRFGDVAVVDRLDLDVPTGSVFGFLGPNGSGKTTTIRMLLGLISPSAGEVELLGRPVPARADQVLPQVGALVEGPAFYPWLSGRKNLERLDAAAPRSRRGDRPKRIDEALARVGLTAAANKRFKAYSLGMRQRLGLANALLQPRRLLILDEPTNGMDPQGTREIRHLINELAAEGATVFVSSHLLAEIEQVCTHVAVMNLGQLVAQGSLAELRQATTARVRVETPHTELAAELFRRHGLSDLLTIGEQVSAELDATTPEDLCRELVEAGVAVRSFGTVRPSLEDTFVALTGEGFDVAR